MVETKGVTNKPHPFSLGQLLFERKISESSQYKKIIPRLSRRIILKSYCIMLAGFAVENRHPLKAAPQSDWAVPARAAGATAPAAPGKDYTFPELGTGTARPGSFDSAADKMAAMTHHTEKLQAYWKWQAKKTDIFQIESTKLKTEPRFGECNHYKSGKARYKTKLHRQLPRPALQTRTIQATGQNQPPIPC